MNRISLQICTVFFFSFLFFVGNTPYLYALDMTSSSFIVRDPIIGTGGEYATSSSFKLFSTGNTVLTGYGSSTSYITQYGFLYFPNPVTSQSLTFSISDSSVGFGSLSSSGARYATNSGGSGSNTIGHTLTASSNATSGYTITYYGATLTSGSNTITAGTITNDSDGTPGTAQFVLSASTNGSATIPSSYQQSSTNWSFVPNTTTTIASTSGTTSSEDISVRYLSNISSTTPAGSYSTNITYIITGNF